MELFWGLIEVMIKLFITVHDLVLKKCWWLLWWLSNVFCLYLRLLTNETVTAGVESGLQVNVAEVKENYQLSITSKILNYIRVYNDFRGGLTFAFYRWEKQIIKWLRNIYCFVSFFIFLIYFLFLFICLFIFIVSFLSHVWLFCDHMYCSLPGSSVNGISQPRITEWAAIFSPGDLPNAGIEPALLHW